ncbi:hypothetical protein VCM_00164 [Pseudomonas phage VCM]|uniref:Uncharacterized protein n=1 Tax=Pseudomonas phage VCM TaxID=1729937 RepID=A0A0S4KZ55_9CAUD|nr:hypothetical protein VCM_00164 [Pseudomonas phage VCM]CUR44366.1 hypothetical protein VCM_00164 [Pseudomonas phage VCM]
MIDATIDFLVNYWLVIAAAYGTVYLTYVFYYLYSIRFKEVRRVTSRDFSEACGEAVFGPFILPCRIIGDALSTVKVSILAMVNVGLPKEVAKTTDRPVV